MLFASGVLLPLAYLWWREIVTSQFVYLVFYSLRQLFFNHLWPITAKAVVWEIHWRWQSFFLNLSFCCILLGEGTSSAIYVVRKLAFLSSTAGNKATFSTELDEQYLTRSLGSVTRYCSCHSNIKFIMIFSQSCNILSLAIKYVWVIDQAWGQDGWIFTKFVFCVFMMDRHGVQVYQLAKRERGQYPAVSTERAWSIKAGLDALSWAGKIVYLARSRVVNQSARFGLSWLLAGSQPQCAIWFILSTHE